MDIFKSEGAIVISTHSDRQWYNTGWVSTSHPFHPKKPQ